MPYMAAKAGVKHMMRHVAYELADYRHPRQRDRARARSSPISATAGSRRTRWCARPGTSSVPVGRMAETYQIKPLALLLASDACELHDRQPRRDRRRHDARQVPSDPHEPPSFQALHTPLAFETLPDPDARRGRGGGQGRPLRHLRQRPAHDRGRGLRLRARRRARPRIRRRGGRRSGKGAEGLTDRRPRLGHPAQELRPLRASAARAKSQWCAQFGLQGGGYAEYALTRPNQCVKLPGSASASPTARSSSRSRSRCTASTSRASRRATRCWCSAPARSASPSPSGPGAWARRKVVVQDVADFQEDRALGMGADAFVVDPADPVGSAERALGGKADIVFECVGIPGLIAQAVEPGAQPRHDPAARPVHPARHLQQLRDAVEGSAAGHLRLLHVPGIPRPRSTRSTPARSSRGCW